MIVIEWLGCGENSDYDVTKLLPEASNLDGAKGQLILVRGIPGSGKSTLAQKLAHWYATEAWYEADNWFTIYDWRNKKTKYKFRGSEIGYAHDWCQGKVAKAMKAHCPYIICSNTNKQLWEMQPYLDMAQAYKYNTTVINCRRHGQSIHNISDDKIAALRLKWEEIPNA